MAVTMWRKMTRVEVELDLGGLVMRRSVLFMTREAAEAAVAAWATKWPTATFTMADAIEKVGAEREEVAR